MHALHCYSVEIIPSSLLKVYNKGIPSSLLKVYNKGIPSSLLKVYIQQGDPLGPLLFCITIQPLIQRLCSDFSVFYLDEDTIGGSRDDILADLQLMENEAATMGLKLNRSKFELCLAMLAPRIQSCSSF